METLFGWRDNGRNRRPCCAGRFYARANPSGQYPSTWTGTAQVDMYELATTSSSCWGFRCWWRSAEAAAWKAAEVVGFVDHAMARSWTVSYCLRQERPPAPATGGCSWISSGHVSCAQPEPENDCSFGACVVMPGKHPGRSPTSLNFTRQEYNTSRQWESRRLSCQVLVALQLSFDIWSSKMLELFCRPNQGSATALGEGREAGTSPLLFVIFMRGVMFCCHLYCFSVPFIF